MRGQGRRVSSHAGEDAGGSGCGQVESYMDDDQRHGRQDHNANDEQYFAQAFTLKFAKKPGPLARPMV